MYSHSPLLYYSPTIHLAPAARVVYRPVTSAPTLYSNPYSHINLLRKCDPFPASYPFYRECRHMRQVASAAWRPFAHVWSRLACCESQQTRSLATPFAFDQAESVSEWPARKSILLTEQLAALGPARFARLPAWMLQGGARQCTFGLPGCDVCEGGTYRRMP